MRTRHNVTLYAHRLTCYVLFKLNSYFRLLKTLMEGLTWFGLFYWCPVSLWRQPWSPYAEHWLNLQNATSNTAKAESQAQHVTHLDMYISEYRQTDNYSFHWAQSGRGPRGDWSSPLLLDAKYHVISDQSERGLGMLLSFLSRPCYCPVRGVVWPLGWPLITIWESPLLSISYMTSISSATLYAAQRRAVICDGLDN